MKKIFAIITIVLLFSKLTLAQVSIQPVLPSVGIVQKNQLWNIVILNNTNTSYTVKLNLVLSDRVTAQDVMTASTGYFVLASGAKQLSAETLMPIQYNYIGSNVDGKIQGLLPVGNYNVCYSLIIQDAKQSLLSEECMYFDVEALSPPMLIFPNDSSVLKESPSQFSWTPPTPQQMFTNLQYEVIIANINDGQKANEAIQENLPFYINPNCITNSMNYASSANGFEKNKWYAWQVVARDNQNYVGKSEVWVFKITSDQVQKIINESPYIKVTTYPQAISTVHQGVLKVEYYHPLSDGVIQIRVIDDNSRNGKYLFTTKLDVKAGQNFLQYDLSKKIKLNEQTIYRVEIENLATEKFVLKFKAKKY
jgi:hypothetical protein